MSNKLIVLIIVVFLLIVVGMFGFAYLKKAEAPMQLPNAATQTGAATTSNTYGITRIEAKHFFIGGVHTIVGELAMPTPCDLLKTESRVAESAPEQVVFDFTVLNTSDSCVQSITTQRFKVSATASAAASLSARFMGQQVELNLVEAAPGETPDQFELFIKG